MALQSSGAISISEIRNEQVNNGGMSSTYSLRGLSSNAGYGTPDAMSEFYGYSAAPPAPTCYYYVCTTPGYYYYFPCYGYFSYDYFEYNQGTCASSPIDGHYNTGNSCLV